MLSYKKIIVAVLRTCDWVSRDNNNAIYTKRYTKRLYKAACFTSAKVKIARCERDNKKTKASWNAATTKTKAVRLTELLRNI